MSVDGEEISRIGPGMLVLLGVAAADTTDDADWIAGKLGRLRIFPGPGGPIDAPLGDREVLCVSQFTLYGDARRGNRPSFTSAAPAGLAAPLYDRVCDAIGARRGRFGADMQVSLTGDGPVTLMLESPPVADNRS